MKSGGFLNLGHGFCMIDILSLLWILAAHLFVDCTKQLFLPHSGGVNLCINQGAEDVSGDGPRDEKHDQKVGEQRDADPEDIPNSNLKRYE